MSVVSQGEVWFPVIIFVGVLVGIWLLHYFISLRLHSLARRSASQLDDVLVYSLERPSRWLLLFVVSLLAVPFAPPELQKISWLIPLLRAGAILTFFIALTNTLVGLVQTKQILTKLSETNEALLVTLIRILTGISCLMVVLDTFGVSVAPLIASLGIGSLAVALALQDTLGNYFSGLYILIDKPIRIGDFVRLEGGIEGHIEKIGWRSTLIKQLSDNIIVVPNTKLASSIITNMSMPEALLFFSVDVGVSYDSNLEQVEKVVTDQARALQMTLTGACSEHEPIVRFTAFNSSSIDFRVILKAQSFTDTHLLRHEFIKSIHQRFRAEGIEIPFPQVVVHSSKGQ